MLREPQHDSMGDVWESSRYTSLRLALEVTGCDCYRLPSIFSSETFEVTQYQS